MRRKDESKMQRIVEFIDERYNHCGVVPTIAEIGEHMGMEDGNVHRYLSDMASRGMIVKGKGWKSIVTQNMQKQLSSKSQIPLLGEIACGTPIFAIENIECYLNIPDLSGNLNEYFGLRAKGDSMINAGIDDGDVVICKKQNYAEQGEIVVALCDKEEATLKRFYKDSENKRIILKPENDNMESMYFDNIDIQGVAKKVIKDLK